MTWKLDHVGQVVRVSDKWMHQDTVENSRRSTKRNKSADQAFVDLNDDPNQDQPPREPPTQKEKHVRVHNRR